MSDDPTQAQPVRPMTQADYDARRTVRQAASAPVGDHPTRDLVIGAVVGAAALWAVPKALDFLIGGGLFGGRDDEEELELEE